MILASASAVAFRGSLTYRLRLLWTPVDGTSCTNIEHAEASVQTEIHVSLGTYVQQAENTAKLMLMCSSGANQD